MQLTSNRCYRKKDKCEYKATETIQNETERKRTRKKSSDYQLLWDKVSWSEIHTWNPKRKGQRTEKIFEEKMANSKVLQI